MGNCRSEELKKAKIELMNVIAQIKLKTERMKVKAMGKSNEHMAQVVSLLVSIVEFETAANDDNYPTALNKIKKAHSILDQLEKQH
jgi:hypothetical protein